MWARSPHPTSSSKKEEHIVYRNRIGAQLARERTHCVRIRIGASGFSLCFYYFFLSYVLNFPFLFGCHFFSID